MTKQTVKPRGARGKGQVSKGDRRRALDIIKNNRYGDNISRALRLALDEAPDQVSVVLAKADAIVKRVDESMTGAQAFAAEVYGAALEHYMQHESDPFWRSRFAFVSGETKPGDFHMVVTLPGLVDGKNTTEEQAREVVKDAELLARTLEHPDCGDAFKSAFASIFTEHILDGSEVSYTTPTVVRVMLPLALLEQWRTHDGSGITPTEILITLSSDLVDDEAGRDVRRGLVPGDA